MKSKHFFLKKKKEKKKALLVISKDRFYQLTVVTRGRVLMVGWDKCIAPLIFLEIWVFFINIGLFFCDICPNLSFRSTI